MTLFEATAAPTDDARLMLLDTYGLVYRAFFALPALMTSKGVPINAAYGFLTMLLKIVADEKPTHVIAAFDKGLPQARLALYDQYKAQRDKMPDDLRSQFELVRRILATYRIPIVEIEGVEADNVIATLAKRAVDEGKRVSVVTGDLDLLQIVDEATTVLVTRRGISELSRYDPAAVRERFDLEPSQLADYRGLKGDPSDNLPGVPGVGEKTASKLIRAAGSLDQLLEDPKLAGSPKLEQLVRTYGEQARVYRDVSIVSRDLALTVPWDAARFATPPTDELFVLYRDLEFKSLLAKLEVPAGVSEVAAGEEPLTGEYVSFVATADDAPDFARLVELLEEGARAERVALAVRNGDEIGVSTETGKGFSFAASAFAVEAVARAFDALWDGPAAVAAYDAKTAVRPAARARPPRGRDPGRPDGRGATC